MINELISRREAFTNKRLYKIIGSKFWWHVYSNNEIRIKDITVVYYSITRSGNRVELHQKVSGKLKNLLFFYRFLFPGFVVPHVPAHYLSVNSSGGIND